MAKRKAITERMKIDCLLWLAQKFQDGQWPPIIDCPECKAAILPGQRIEWDHRHAVVFDGPHEYQNLRPIHYDPCHKKKTARDIKAHAKVKRIISKALTKRKPTLRSRGFRKDLRRKMDGTVEKK